MESFLKIPLTFAPKGRSYTFERVSIEKSIVEFINFLVVTKQGECAHNYDFGYSIWSNEFEPILNTMQWQPRFIEQVRYILEKYEPRITDIVIREPEIKILNKKDKSDRDYKITLTISYRIVSTKEQQNDIKISFEY
jgi:phage baseplate assembly protein W